MEAGLETTARVAADTGSMLKQGLMETTEKVKASRVGQQLTELTANGMERSKGLLQKVDWRRRGTAVPFVVIQCCNFILQNDPNAETPPDASLLDVGQLLLVYLKCLPEPLMTFSLFPGVTTVGSNPNADIPSDTSPLDVGQLLLVYLKCLPEPLMTFSLFSGVATVGSSDVTQLRRLLHTLPAVNLETLHAVLCLLYRVSLHADVNKLRRLLHTLPSVNLETLHAVPCLLYRVSLHADVNKLRRLLHTLPSVNLETLHAVLCLLYRVSLHADVNKVRRDVGDSERGLGVCWPRIKLRQLLHMLPPVNLETLHAVLCLQYGVSLHADVNKGSAASAAAGGGSGSGGGGGGGGGGDAMASPAMRRAQSEKGMRVGDGGSAAAAAATVSAGPAVVEANGESSVPEIPLEEEPTQAQTAIVEAIMVLIDSHESIFSHNPGGPILLPVQS
ncbi:unnamed protein product [Closterium sp. NIES-64]|nr:unnamed protein product [Closterium sp. NIES-64]